MLSAAANLAINRSTGPAQQGAQTALHDLLVCQAAELRQEAPSQSQVLGCSAISSYSYPTDWSI